MVCRLASPCMALSRPTPKSKSISARRCSARNASSPRVANGTRIGTSRSEQTADKSSRLVRMTCQNETAAVTQVLEEIGAGEGNRTLVISLEGCCSTIELHPRTRSPTCEPAFAKASAGAFATGRLASRGAAGAAAGGGGRTRTYEGVSQRIYRLMVCIDIVHEFAFMSRLCRVDESLLRFNDLTPPAD